MANLYQLTQISIHPPREGWDPLSKWSRTRTKEFQSTHPARGGTSLFYSFFAKFLISIHPPREGWDHCAVADDRVIADFNPPTPRGVGLYAPGHFRNTWNFNPPTPRGVGRYTIIIGFCINKNFNPPTPRGVGPLTTGCGWTISNFNPPTPRGVGLE